MFGIQLNTIGIFVLIWSMLPISAARSSESTLHDIFSKIEQGSHAPHVSALSSKQIELLYQETIEHPVARLDILRRYDLTGTIGFCFGRAMAAHLLARRMGLDRAAIAKLFIIGDLRSTGRNPEWRFHVTTLVLGNDGILYAIDPIMYAGGPFRPLRANQWIAAVRNGWDRWHGKQPQAKLYLTSGNTVLPDVRVLPEPEQGSKIIELNFEPSQHGIRASAEWKLRFGLAAASTEKIYEATRANAEEFFLTTDGSEYTRFDFSDIEINGQKLNYNGYFADLLADLAQAKLLVFGSLEKKSSVKQPVLVIPCSRLLSRSAAPSQWVGGFNLSRLRR